MTVLTKCACREPLHSPSYHEGHASRNCARCGFVIDTQPWHLTPDGLRQFLLTTGEGMPDFREPDGSPHPVLSYFASLAIPRALEDGADHYGLHDFLEREIDHEAGEELLDVANYCHMRALKDRWEVEQGKRDPEHAAERERKLMGLAAETIRLFEQFRIFAS